MSEPKDPPPEPWRLEEPEGLRPTPGTPSPGLPPRGPRGVGGVAPRRRAVAGPRGSGKRLLVIFLLVNIIPAAAAVWWFTQPKETRERFLEAIPEGVGTRAGIAALSFALLIVLAKVVLPGARMSGVALARAMAWFRTRKPALRVLLFPAEAVVGLVWFLSQVLFAVDAVAVLACAAAFLLYVVRIFKPELFAWLPG